jgi:hypothetical protein
MLLCFRAENGLRRLCGAIDCLSLRLALRPAAKGASGNCCFWFGAKPGVKYLTTPAVRLTTCSNSAYYMAYSCSAVSGATAGCSLGHQVSVFFPAKHTAGWPAG